MATTMEMFFVENNSNVGYIIVEFKSIQVHFFRNTSLTQHGKYLMEEELRCAHQI